MADEDLACLMTQPNAAHCRAMPGRLPRGPDAGAFDPVALPIPARAPRRARHPLTQYRHPFASLVNVRDRRDGRAVSPAPRDPTATGADGRASLLLAQSARAIRWRIHA